MATEAVVKVRLEIDASGAIEQLEAIIAALRAMDEWPDPTKPSFG